MWDTSIWLYFHLIAFLATLFIVGPRPCYPVYIVSRRKSCLMTCPENDSFLIFAASNSDILIPAMRITSLFVIRRVQLIHSLHFKVHISDASMYWCDIFLMVHGPSLSSIEILRFIIIVRFLLNDFLAISILLQISSSCFPFSVIYPSKDTHLLTCSTSWSSYCIFTLGISLFLFITMVLMFCI